MKVANLHEIYKHLLISVIRFRKLGSHSDLLCVLQSSFVQKTVVDDVKKPMKEGYKPLLGWRQSSNIGLPLNVVHKQRRRHAF